MIVDLLQTRIKELVETLHKASNEKWHHSQISIIKQTLRQNLQMLQGVINSVQYNNFINEVGVKDA